MSKIIKAKNSVNEGDEINFFVMGLKPNTSYAPKLGDEILKPGTKPCILDDIDPKSLNSVKSDASGFATFSIKLKSDVNTEGLESLSLIVDGTKSGVVNVYDTSKTPIKAVIPDKLKVIEGNNVNFTIGAPDGIYNYSFTGTVDKNDYKVTLKSDVVTESTVTIKDGTGSLTIAINNDSVLEDPETLILTLTPSGDIAGGASSFSCAPVTINEKSLGIPKLTSSSVSATEDNSVIFTLNEIAPGIYPYTLDIISTSESIKKTPLIYSGVYEDLGTPTVKNGSISITSSTSGTISVNENNTAINLTVPIQGDHFTESTEILTLTLGSPKLTIENNMLVSIVNGLTSSVVIKDTSVDYSYKLSVSTSTVNEGSSVVFNITDGKPNTTIGYKIKDYTPTTKNDFSVVANDFTVSQNGPVLLDLGSNVGNVTIGSDGKASFSIYVNADAIYDGNKVKAPEKFQVVLNDNANEPVDIIVVGTIPVVTINDTSFT